MAPGHQLSVVDVKLESQTNLDPGLRKCGGWYLADSPGEKASMIGLSDYWAGHKLTLMRLLLVNLQSASQLRSMVKRGKRLSGVGVSNEFQLQTRNYIHCIKEACMYQGVRLREKYQVTKVQKVNQNHKS